MKKEMPEKDILLNMRIFLLLILFMTGTWGAAAQSIIEKVESLQLKSIDDNIIAYYSDGYRNLAENNIQLLNGAADFFDSF